MRSPVEYEEDHAAGDPDGLARARTHAPAREKKTVDNLKVVNSNYDKDNLTPRNRGRSSPGKGRPPVTVHESSLCEEIETR